MKSILIEQKGEMAREEVYERISNGTLTLEAFEEWCSEQRHDAYCSGEDQARYEAATSA